MEQEEQEDLLIPLHFFLFFLFSIFYFYFLVAFYLGLLNVIATLLVLDNLSLFFEQLKTCKY